MRPLCAEFVSAIFDPWFSDDPAEQSWAREVCANCPVGPACLAGAIERGERYGMWFGVAFGVVGMADPDEAPAETVHAPSRGCYVGGCREPGCCSANTRWIAEWRTRRHDSPPPAREPLPEQLSLDLTAVTTPDWINA